MKYFLKLLLLFLLLATAYEQCFAEDIGSGAKRDLEEAFQNLGRSLRDLRDRGIGGFLEGLDERKRLKDAETTPREHGYCQTWTVNQLNYRETCAVFIICETDRNCTLRFVWNNKNETVIIQSENSQTLIDNHPAYQVKYGEDICYRDTIKGTDFCYTRAPQSPSLTTSD